MMKKNLTSTKKPGSYNGYNNRPHKIPDPKLLKINTKYALSLNPSAKPIQYVEKNDTFKYNFRHYHNTILNKINKCNNCIIDIIPELSSSGKYHYHGYITIINLAYFMLMDVCILRQYFAFEIDIINDSKVWEEYVNKGSHYMESFCISEKIPYKIKTGDKPVKLRDEDKLFDQSYEWDEDVDYGEEDLDIFRKKEHIMCPPSDI